MTNLGASIGWGLAITASLVAGGVVVSAVGLPARAAATITAFGGGVLLAAIALELVPEADERAGVALTAGGLLAGTLLYVAADAWLSRDEDMMAMRRMGHAAAAGRPIPMRIDRAAAARGESIAVGIFVDGVPESMALGLTVAAEGRRLRGRQPPDRARDRGRVHRRIRLELTRPFPWAPP